MSWGRGGKKVEVVELEVEEEEEGKKNLIRRGKEGKESWRRKEKRKEGKRGDSFRPVFNISIFTLLKNNNTWYTK